MSSLQPAHRGYEYQDLWAAARSIGLLMGSLVLVLADEKLVEGDRFDDLTTVDSDGLRERVQFKHRDAEGTPLTLATFTADSRQLELGKLISCAVADRDGPGRDARSIRLRVLLRDIRPTDPKLTAYLKPTPNDVGPFLAGMNTLRLQFNAEAIWPANKGTEDQAGIESNPFAYLRTTDGLSREDLVWLCEALTIEVEAPSMTGDLRAPGVAEKVLLNRVVEEVGAGEYPNEHRSPVDVAGALVTAARMARQGRIRLTSAELLGRSQLRNDFGSVPHIDPVRSDQEVARPAMVSDLAAIAANAATDRIPMVLVGPPGQGKSWTCKQLVGHLREQGWLVADHYCYLGAADDDREVRVYTSHVFGTLLDAIGSADPSLVADLRPRFTADQRALETAVSKSLARKPDRPVALVIDGLDHVSRVSAPSRTADPSRQLAEELASLSLPQGSVLIVLSQPGDHLAPFENVGATVAPILGFSLDDTHDLVARLSTSISDRESMFSTDEIVRAVHGRSNGNALYSTYLCRELFLRSIPLTDAVQTIDSFPPYTTNLAAYYEHLYVTLGSDAAWVAELLPFLDFSVTPMDLREIRPDGAHHVDRAIRMLEPVLETRLSGGGLRVYHESFARFLADKLVPDVTRAINERIAGWLESKGFFTDVRAYRFLLHCLAAGGNDSAVTDLVPVGFLAKSVAAGFPASAILNNLVIAVASAARLGDWPSIIRFIELARGATNFEYERLDNAMAEFADVLSAVLGGEEFASRLVFEGTPTMPARVGLQICAAFDELGYLVPWQSYIDAFVREDRADNTHYGSDSDAAAYLAILRGQLRLSAAEDSPGAAQPPARDRGARWAGSPESLKTLVDYVDRSDFSGDEVARAVLATRGPAAALAVARELSAPASFSLAAAQSPLVTDRETLDGFLELASGPNRDRGTARTLLTLGVPLTRIAQGPRDVRRNRLLSLTARVQETNGFGSVMDEWLDLCTLAAIDDPLGLAIAETAIGGTFWYRNWLRFSIGVARAEAANNDLQVEMALESIGLLKADLDPFAGDPRACDLYSIWKQVHGTIRRAVDLLNDDGWRAAIAILSEVSGAISTTLVGELGGPFASDDLIHLAVETGSVPGRLEKVLGLIETLIEEDGARRYYSDLGIYRLWAARASVRRGDLDGAERWWIEACQMLSGYGFHKDVTIFELLDPLPDLIIARPFEGRTRVAAVQPVVERIPSHTDGKETRHAWSRWWDLLALADPSALAALTGPAMLKNVNSSSYLHEGAREELWRNWHAEADPTLASLLRMTLDLVLDPKDARALELLLDSPSAPSTLISQTLALADNRPSSYSYSNDHDLLNRDVRRLEEMNEVAHRFGAPQITEWSDFRRAAGDSDTSSISKPSSSPTGQTGPLRTEVVGIPAGPLGLAYAVRAWKRRPYDASGAEWDVTRFANAIGYRLVDMAENGHSDDAEMALRTVVEADRWHSELDLLPILATGLEMRGQPVLAAIANAFVWTRSRGGGGWFAFGGQTQINSLARAIELDRDVAIDVLAEEIERTMVGREVGMTKALIHAFTHLDFSKSGDATAIDVAFEAWDQALSVIESRAPRVHVWDDPDEPYVPQSWENGRGQPHDLDAAFAATVITGIANAGREQKRRSALAIRMLLEVAPSIAGRALAFLLPNLSDAATLTWLLRLIDSSSDRSEVIAQCETQVNEFLNSEFLTVRSIARRLLPDPSAELPATAPDDALLTTSRGGELWLPIGREPDEQSHDGLDEEIVRQAGYRISRGEQMLPNLGEAVTRRVRTYVESVEFQRRVKSQMESLGRADGIPDAHLALEESMESALQTVASGGRLAMLANGRPVSNPIGWEAELAEAILDDPNRPLELESTRHPRPELPLPPGQSAPEWADLFSYLRGDNGAHRYEYAFRLQGPSLVVGTCWSHFGATAQIKGGVYDGWRVIGSEEDRRVGPADRNNRGLLVLRYNGLEFRRAGDHTGLGNPPLAPLDSRTWGMRLDSSRAVADDGEPWSLVAVDKNLEAYDDALDGLGIPRKVAVPTERLRHIWSLEPIAPYLLADAVGPAAGLITWRTDYVRSDYHLPRPRMSGSAVVLRPDLFDNLVATCGRDLILRDYVVAPEKILDQGR